MYGGKGINVLVVLTRLGIDNTALGFVAGFTGDAEKALCLANAAGTATAFSKYLATKEEIEKRM